MGELTNKEAWDRIPAGSIVRFSDGLECIKMYKYAYDGITDSWVTIIKGPNAGSLLHINHLMLAYESFQNEFTVKLL